MSVRAGRGPRLGAWGAPAVAGFVALALAVVGLVGVGAQAASAEVVRSAAAPDATADCSSLALGVPCQLRYSKESAHTTLTIPPSVPTVTFLLSGASGGGGGHDLQGPAGTGGSVVGTISVESGGKLEVWLGQPGAGADGKTNGWSQGGAGGHGRNHDGAAGGGSSALAWESAGHDAPLAVAGGGGGAGGAQAFENKPNGGRGGAGGKPPTAGGPGTSTGYAGRGGQGGAAHRADGDDGSGGYTGYYASGGGGGGGGYGHGGGGGEEGASPGQKMVAQAAGGGGGGVSYAAREVEGAYFASGHPGGGRLTVFPGAPLPAKHCVSSSDNPQKAAVPSDVSSYGFVAVGGSGTHGHNDAPAGTGAVQAGYFSTAGIRSLDIWVGCDGYSHAGAGYGGTGAGGDSNNGNDGGRGGGASAIADAETRSLIAVAGGGGGNGGDIGCGSGFPGESCGGVGGSSAGVAGTIFAANGLGGGWNAFAAGGCADCHGGKHPDRNGEEGHGSGSYTQQTGGGGGGGAGYPAGGAGGHHITGYPGGGGGAGGAYLSTRVGAKVSEPSGVDGDGFVLLIPFVKATSSLTVTVTASGDGARFAGTFRVHVVCTLGSSTTLDQTTALAAGHSHEFTALPSGSECTATETGTGGASTPAAPQKVTLPDAGAHLTLDNVFAVADLGITVRSAITGTNPGTSFTLGSLGVQLACVLDGSAVPLPDPAASGTVVIDGQETWAAQGATVTVPGLPVGASCTATEAAGSGATSVAYSVNGTSQPGTDATIVLTPEKNGIGVDNDYLLGSLIVTQSTDGGSPPPPDAQFGGTIACTFQSRAVTLGGGHDFVLGVGASQTLTGLPIGADCTVDETDTDGAVAIGYAPSQTVPITADPPTVTVTATFQTGSLLLTVRSIGTAAAWANTPAEVRVTCVQDDTVVFDETVTVQGASGGWGAVAAPGGSQCSAQDTGVTGATSTSYSSSVDPTPQPQPVTVTVGQGGTATLHVDNAFIAAPLEVASVTGGAGAIFAKPAATRVDQCTFAGAGIDIVPGSASQSFTFPRQGGSASIALPAGASCRVTLTDAGATSSQVASTVNAAPVTSLGDTSLRATVNLTTGDQDPSSAVTFTNTLDVGRLPISVDVTGAAAWAASVPITVDVTCSLGGDPLTPLGPDGTVAVHFSADGTLVPDDGSAALAALPLGSSCSAVQQGDNGATAVDYEPAGSGSGGSADVPIELGGAAIVVTDRFDAADLVVSTTVAGNDGANHLDGDFGFDSACSFNGRILPPPPDDPTRPSAFSITGEGTHTIAGLPVGTSCTVTEYGTQNATQIAPSREQTAAIEAAGSAIGFENAFDSAPLGVSASIVGPAASQYAPQTVGATVSCQWPDGSGTADLPDGGQLVLDAGNDFEASLDAPYGTSCSVASPAGMATAVHVTPPVTMGLGDQHLLAITSEWDLASATVAKHTSGVFAGNLSFSFDARCTWADGSIPVPLAQGSSASFGLRSGGSATMTVLAGSTCAITETDAGGAARTDIVVADAITSAVNGRTAQVRLDAGTQPRIDVTNVAEAAADPLASTGSDAQAWLWLAVLLLAAGGVVLLARRRA